MKTEANLQLSSRNPDEQSIVSFVFFPINI